jgi:hypothetical protein
MLWAPNVYILLDDLVKKFERADDTPAMNERSLSSCSHINCSSSRIREGGFADKISFKKFASIFMTFDSRQVF